jgi:hypothetical protein
MEYTQRAKSFEQDLYWSILDLDAVPDILKMANDNWSIDAATVWKILQQQAADGRLVASRGTDPVTPVDLITAAFDEVAHDYLVFVQPTPAAVREGLTPIKMSGQLKSA